VTRRLAGIAVVVVACGLLLLAGRILSRNKSDWYQARGPSESAEWAQSEGVFLSAVTAIDRQSPGRAPPARLSAWIERESHVEYAWLVLRRRVTSGRFRLVVRFPPGRTPTQGRARLVPAAPAGGAVDTLRLSAMRGNILGFEISEPFPDTVYVVPGPPWP
jgi:hypothetical protein